MAEVASGFLLCSFLSALLVRAPGPSRGPKTGPRRKRGGTRNSLSSAQPLGDEAEAKVAEEPNPRELWQSEQDGDYEGEPR